MKSEGDRMVEECEAEFQTHMASVISRHMSDPDSELSQAFQKELTPWRAKWDQVLELEELFRS